VYNKYEENEACPHKCEDSEKFAHYHCNWVSICFLCLFVCLFCFVKIDIFFRCKDMVGLTF
jgi:hypothetical protein